jgi:ABC-type branched-subunit amino acid transport system ATPase component
MTALLETRSLSKSFGALRATSNVTFTLEEGARHALIGPNGAGKTTFINLLTGVLAQAPARCCSRARTLRKSSRPNGSKLGIARTFQINRLFRGLTVLENVYMAIAERVGAAPNMVTPAGSRRDVIDEAMELLTRLKLADIAHKTIPSCPTAASGWSSLPSRSG